MQNLQDPIEAHPSCDILKSKAENRIDENLKPIESMNFKISFMPRKAIGICNPKEYSKKSNLSSWRENLRVSFSCLSSSRETVKNKLNMEMIHSITSKCLESFILSYSRDYICILSLNVSILVSNVDVPFYPQGIQYVGQMGT
ncbi:unnamed protein product [Rhizophagus irregularis]|nr:unnamed protein product [Rhizophagus irregularis]